MGKRILTSVLIVLILFTNLAAYGEIVMPEPTKMFYANDFADVIDEDVEASIINVNLNYEKTAQKPQIVVTTVQNMQGLDENSYASELFEKWKIGNKEYNNGVLILLAIDERRVKIETGYGLEGTIPDSLAGRILDSSTSYLSEGNYSKGIENIFFQVAKAVNKEYDYDDNVIFENMNVDVQEQTENRNQVRVFNLIKPILIIILLLFFGGFGGGPGRRRRRSFYIPPSIFRGGGGFGGFGGGSFGGGGRSGGGGAGRGF
nr:TPM domain-containing protein [Sedimentibacter sp.]